MKDFNTFINEQRELLNEKGSKSDPNQGVSNKADAFAGMGGGINVSTTLFNPTPGSHSSPMLSAGLENSVYDFASLFASGEFENLLGDTMMQKVEYERLQKVIDDMPNSHRKNALIKDMQKVSTMPVSEYRTKKAQQIMNDINGFAGTLQQGSLPYNDYNSDVFIPNKIPSWSNT